MKVRVGSWYTYSPNLVDTMHVILKNPPSEGQRVKVINLPGAPKANTMGQCYVENEAGEFLGMVSTGSLTPAKKARKVDPVYAVIETDEQGVPQQCVLRPTKAEAIAFALAIGKEYGLDTEVAQNIMAEDLENDGHANRVGWVIAVLLCETS